MHDKGWNGDDVFQELVLMLRQSILNWDPRRGRLSTVFYGWSRNMHVYFERERRESNRLAAKPKRPKRFRGDLDRLLQQYLPQPLAAVAQMRFVEQFTTCEIAEWLEEDENTVDTLIEEIVELLRDTPEILEHLAVHKIDTAPQTRVPMPPRQSPTPPRPDRAAGHSGSIRANKELDES